MFELKRLSKDAVGAAMEKALRYRVLNEPAQAESICRDVLAVEPDRQEALVTLLLSVTDQFGEKLARVDDAWAIIPRLEGEYERAYYSGIICERRANALREQGLPGCGFTAYDGLRQAMEWYEKAEKLRPKGNDDAILRWNTCARAIMRHPHVRPVEREDFIPLLE